MTPWRVVFVCLLTVLTGCNAAVPAADYTVTPAPVPVDEASAASSVSLPPGVSADGVIDPDRLARAHRKATGATAYSLVAHRIQYLPSRELSTPREVETTTVRQAESTRYNATTILTIGTDIRLTDREVREYADGEDRYLRVETSEGITYERRSLMRWGDEGNRFNDEMAAMVATHLSVRQATVTRTTHGGRPAYRIEGNGTTAPELANATAYRLTAVVSPDGFVYAFRAVYSPEGSRGSIELTWRYTDIGETTVDEPTWLQTARERAD